MIIQSVNLAVGSGVYNVPSNGYFEIERVYSTSSGLSIFSFYTDSTRSAVALLGIAGYSAINLGGQIIETSRTSIANQNITSVGSQLYPIGRGETTAVLGGSNDNIFWLYPSSRYISGTDYGRSLYYMHGGLGSDIAIIPINASAVIDSLSNSLGITKVSTTDGDIYLIGVERIDLLDSSLLLPSGIISASIPNLNEYGLINQFHWGDGQIGNIDGGDNVAFVPLRQYLESTDFLGGIDTLVMAGFASTNVTLAFIDNIWGIYGNGFSASYRNLEYIQFSDTAYSLGVDGRKAEIPFSSFPPKIITLRATTASVTEDSNTPLVYTFTRTGSTASALEVNYTVGGTARLTGTSTDSPDYAFVGSTSTATSRRVIFAAGSSKAQVQVRPIADTRIEPNETVTLQLTSGTGYTVGTTTAVTGTIVNDDISSFTSRTLQTGESTLILLGTAAINGTGNTLNNVLTGNGASNTLNGGVGADSMRGGLGNDIYVVDNTGDVVSEGLNAGTDTVRASISHTLRSNVENLVMTGTSAINGTGNTLNNRLTGNAANNILKGGAGADTINGGGGNDTIIGGLGRDVMTGSTGVDKFVYSSVADSGVGSAARDVITDFQGSAGERINLFAIDAYTKTTGNQAFTYIGSNAFTGSKGEVRFSGGVLQLNTGTDKTADMEIALSGVTAFSSTFLVL